MLMAALKIAVETNLLENYFKNSKFGSTSEGCHKKIVKINIVNTNEWKKVPTSNIKLKQMFFL